MAVTWGPCLVLLLCYVVQSGAQYAKSSYYTDTASDCYISGYLLIKSDGVVNINSRNPQGVGSSDVLQCSLKFKPESDNDIMDMDLTYFSISDPDVTLRLEVSGAGSYTLTSASSQPSKLSAKAGLATIILTRLSLNDKDFSFGVVLRVYKENNSNLATDESPVAVGLVVGIVGGIIGFIIIMAIFIVCCWRKKRARYHRDRGEDTKKDLTAEPISPAHSYGFDNSARNGTSGPRWGKDRDDDYHDDSPRSKKKLLGSQNNRMTDYRDRSESESEMKEKDPYIISQFDRSPTKTAKLNYENERARQPPQQNNVQMRRDRQEAEKDNNENQNLSPKSPLLAALHNNPRFRASFTANEVDAEERRKRISSTDQDAGNDGSDSDVSMTETWNTTFDTQFDDDERPPPRTVSKPPTLPPIPKSPGPPLRQENTASIRRAPRPSSSSSEIEQLQNVEMDTGIKLVQKYDPPSPSEVIPIRINDPHSPTMKRRPDIQHNLRPDRKTKTPKEKHSKSPDPVTQRAVEETFVKTKPVDIKPPKQTKADAKTGTVPEHEGRFKKAPSGRKKTSKSPRIGRSRSAGDFIDDAGPRPRSASASSYNRVPIVTADDYEDSDMESNYNPLRRTGSKNSLYASRSSLYGRRRRKSSMGSVASLAYDDMDFNHSERGSFTNRSLSRHDRGFKSLGDLEQEMREQATRSTQTLRECATQTGTGFANVTPGKKTVVKRKKPRSVSSSTTQTGKTRNLHDTSSSSSGASRPRSRKNSASSTSGLAKSRERKNSTSSTSGKSKRTKSEAEGTAKRVKEKEGRPETPKGKPKTAPKPKPKPRKSAAASDGHLTDSGDELDQTSPIDQSSMASGSVAPGATLNPAVLGQSIYPPQPGYPAGYPMGYPPQMTYMQAPGQPPIMMSFAPQPGAVPMHASAVTQNPGPAAASVPGPAAPVFAPKPVSKWDMLCKMTGGEAGASDSLETGSVAGSVFSQGFSAQHIPPPYSSAVSDYYTGSEQSAPRSARAPSQASGAGGEPRKSSWGALKEMTDREYKIAYGSEYAQSESNV